MGRLIKKMQIASRQAAGTILIFIPALCLSMDGLAQRPKGFVEADFAYLIGQGSIDYQNTLSLAYTGDAYQLGLAYGRVVSSRMQVLLGLALCGYHNPSYNTLPVTAEGRIRLFADRGLFFRAGAGFAPSLSPSFQKGYLYRLGVGHQLNLGKRPLILSLYYKAQQIEDDNIVFFDLQQGQIVSYQDAIVLRSIAFSIGLQL